MNFYLEGPGGSYRFSGYAEYKAWINGLNSICGTRVGKQVMNFSDGGLISIKDPHVEITGITYGERVHSLIGQLQITDHINKLEAIVTCNTPGAHPDKSSFRNEK
jgi:hypothetical protein